MDIRAQSLERALPAIAGFIADRTGIPIVRSDRAQTDNVAIYLPRRRSELDLAERDLVESVGFLYHEAGHMRHSNFALTASSPLQRAITGVLEDVRIERLVMQAFPGARRYLSRLVGYMVEDGAEGRSGFPAVQDSDSEATVLQRYLLYRLRHEVLAQEPVRVLAEAALGLAKARFPAGMLTRLEALMFEVTSCESEDDVFDLADAIIEMIKEERDKEEERERNAETQQQAGGEAGGEEDGQQAGPDPSSSGTGPSALAGSSPEAVEPGAADAAGSDGAATLDRLLGMSDEDVQEDLGEMLRSALNAAAQADSRSSGSLGDVGMPNVHKAVLSAGSVDMARLRASVNATRTRTLQWMSAVVEGDVSHSASGMLIDSSRLWQRGFGGPIFVREDEGIDINAAVSIVVDRSGSMSSRIGQAIHAAVATMLAFDVPGLKTQVTVFPWYHLGDEGVAVLKRWDESPRALAGRVASISTEGGTPMAEGILFAASDIVRREESLKMVLVVTDGEPNNRPATQYVIDRVRADGITVVGLGIGVDTGPVFGPAYAATIHDIGQLSGSMVQLVKAAFQDHRRAL